MSGASHTATDAQIQWRARHTVHAKGIEVWPRGGAVRHRRGAHMPGTGGSNGDVSQAAPAKQLSCTPFVDQLYFCYSPVWQLQELYRQGHLDDCKAKWSQLFECASLRAKPDAEARVRIICPLQPTTVTLRVWQR